MKAWEDKIRRVTPYTPGEQPQEPDKVKLNTNENPYPPSPAVKKALDGMDEQLLRLYPDPTASVLTKAIAGYHGVGQDQVFVGVGSDDVIAMAFMTFFSSGKPIFFPDVTYSFYPVWADLFKIPYETKPLGEHFEIRPEDYYDANGGVIFPNPNAPTSRLEKVEVIEDILDHNQDCIVIVDEAYVDFADYSVLPLLDRYENLLVVRTFSKSRSLAGMRIGYAIGSPELIKAMSDIKYSYNSYTINQTSLAAGAASISDETYFRETIERIKATRRRSCERFTELGFRYTEPQANFIFVTHPDLDAGELFKALREAHIYVRYFDAPRTRDYLRVTIGTDAQMDLLFDFLKDYEGRV